MGKPLAVSFSVLLLGCSSDRVKRESSSSQPPAPGISRRLPDSLTKDLGKTAAGKPILAEGHLDVGGAKVALVYDESLDTPMTRWGQCLSRVHACYRANPGPIAGCIDRIEICASDAGGEQCCPRPCVDEFHARLRASPDQDSAINDSFLRGGCIPGFLEGRSGQ